MKKEEGGFLSSGFVTAFLVLALLAVIGFGVWELNSLGIISIPSLPQQKSAFSRALEENNYQAAAICRQRESESDCLEALKQNLEEYLALCRSDAYEETTWSRYRGLEIFSADIQEDVLAAMDQVMAEENAGELTKDQASSYLRRIGKFEFASHKLTDCLNQLSA